MLKATIGRRRAALALAGLVMAAGCAVAPSALRQAHHDAGAEPDTDAPRGPQRDADYLRPEAELEAEGALTAMPPPSADAVAATGALPVTTAYGEWHSVGARNLSGKVYAIAQSHQRQGTVYVSYGSGGVWKTEDGGANWRLLTDRTQSKEYDSVEVWPGGDDVVAIGTGALAYPGPPQNPGLFLSTDGGKSWRTITPPVVSAESNAFVQISFDPADWHRMVVGTLEGVYLTTDGGAHWTLTLAVPHRIPTFRPDLLPAIARHPGDAKILLAQQRELGIQRSTDGGAHWNRVAPELTNRQLGSSLIAWSKSDPKKVYLATNPQSIPPANPGDPSPNPPAASHVYRSYDGGLTWPRGPIRVQAPWWNEDGGYGAGLCQVIVAALAVDPTDPEHVLLANSSYFSTHDGFAGGGNGDRLFRSGFEYSYVATYRSVVDFLAVAFDRFDPKIVYVGGDQGVYKLVGNVDDTNPPPGQLLPARFDVGVESSHLYKIAIAVNGTARRGFATIGDYGSPVWGDLGSDSAARSWDQWGSNAPEYSSVYVNPIEPTTVFNGGGSLTPLQRALRWPGATSDWEYVDPLLDNAATHTASRRQQPTLVAFHPTLATTVLIDNPPTGAAAQALFRSTNRGAPGSWSAFGPVTTKGAVDIAYAPSNGNVIYVLERPGPDQRLWRSADGGATWVSAPADPMYQLDAHYVAVAPNDPNRYYVATGADVMDCTWSAACVSVFANYTPRPATGKIVIDPSEPDRLYVASPGYVITAQRPQYTWEIVGHLLPRFATPDLQVRNQVLYVATNMGLWEARRDYRTTLPAIVGGLAATRQSTTSVRLQWTPQATYAKGYKILRDGTQLYYDPSATAAAWTDTATDAARHCYVVLGVAANGDVSPWQDTPACAP